MRVLHLTGSPTDAFHAELSRLYAADCLDVLAAAGHEQVVAHVSPGGTWRFPADLTRAAVEAAAPLALRDAVTRLADCGADVAVPQLFCRPGMTTYRALLDLLGIPFVGNRADVMAIGADKARCRAIVSAAGVAVPPAELVRAGGRPTDAVALPVVVKPVDTDNSVGVTLVRHRDELDDALGRALAHAPAALVERYVELGREVRCGVLERDGELTVLPVEEYAVDTERKPIRDAADKIVRRADGELSLVAKDAEHAWIVPPTDPVNATVAEAARAAHRALGARHYSLFDFRVDPAGRAWFLEAGLYCSFARSSVVAVMAAASGLAVAQLFEQCAGQALRSGAPA